MIGFLGVKNVDFFMHMMVVFNSIFYVKEDDLICVCYTESSNAC